MQIRYKIIVSIYAILLPVIIASSIFLYVNESRQIKAETIQLYKRFSQTIRDDISYMQRDVLDIEDFYAVNSEIHKVLISDKKNYEDDDLFWYNNTPISFQQDMLAIKSHIKTLILYPENGLDPYYQSRDASVHNTSLEEVRELSIYKKALQAKGDVIWEKINSGKPGIYLKNRKDKVVACRMLFDLSKKDKIGFLVLGVDALNYNEICNKMLQSNNEGIAVITSDGEVFSSVGQVDEAFLARIIEKKYMDSSCVDEPKFFTEYNNYIFISKCKDSDVGVCYILPVENVKSKMREGLVLPGVLIVILLIGSGPFSLLISKALSRPTQQLCDSMEQFRSGDFDTYITVENEDEIGRLAVSFNRMVEDIKELINTNYVMEIKEKESELDALQSQINPHFLYNVLDSLYWQAEEEGNEKIAGNILALSTLFRLVLSHGNKEIPVKKEVELIGCYLQIQEMRFSKRLTYVIQVDESIGDYRIGKLTLQPFIENAVVHGLEAKDRGGCVYITGVEEDNYLVFNICDNGIGMEQEEADKILYGKTENAKLNERVGGYAIRNVRERLELRYGTDFEIKIISRPQQGTLVSIRIPAVKE
jgi:two-component system sensor histidine kinase YesM